MKGLKVGNGLDDGVALGPLVNAEAREKVVELVGDAVAKGAKVVTGGKAIDGPGYFYPATVLTDVPDNAELLREEIFGPVAPIQKFSEPRRGRHARQTRPSTASSPTCTRATSATACASRKGSTSAWSASIAGWSPTRPPRSAA